MKYFELNASPVYDGRYMKTKTGIYGDNVYPNFHGLNMPEDGVWFESFLIISIDSITKYHTQKYYDNCAYKIIGKWMIDYLDDKPFQFDQN